MSTRRIEREISRKQNKKYHKKIKKSIDDVLLGISEQDNWDEYSEESLDWTWSNITGGKNNDRG